MNLKLVPVTELIGKTFTSVTLDKETDQISFVGEGHYMMRHEQSCCEMVSIEDICGDLSDLVGAAIMEAEEVTYNDPNVPADLVREEGSYTWTFYKLGTVKGGVTIRWYGTSNGCYSETATLVRVDP